MSKDEVIAQKNSEIAEMKEVITDMKEVITGLQHQLAILQKALFGPTSERQPGKKENPHQLTLDLGQAEVAEAEAKTETVTYQRKKPKAGSLQPVRKPLPEHLERVEEVIEPEGDLSTGRVLGEEVTELLEYTPAQLKVRKIIRPKYLMPTGEILVAPMPTDIPIPRSNPAASLLAHIAVSKTVDHLPVYRIRKQLKRSGIDLPDSTLYSWFHNTAALLEPLYDCLAAQVKNSAYLQTDESPIPVLDRDKKKAHKGYMWVYHAPRLKLTCFDYQKGRSREGPKQFLKHFTGIVQTDGYVVYDYLDEETTIVHLACWAHVRRKFFDAQKNDEARAQHALAEIGLLYGIERFARRIKMNKTEELRHRKDHAHPIMERLYRWAIEERAKMTNSEPIAKAIDYMLGMWKKLKAYANNGITRLDNNLVENQIRPMVIGRKNYLFAGSAKGAKALAIYYSLFACCHLNGVDPYKWLVDVLKRINEQPMYLLKELLPNQVSISE